MWKFAIVPGDAVQPMTGIEQAESEYTLMKRDVPDMAENEARKPYPDGDDRMGMGGSVLTGPTQAPQRLSMHNCAKYEASGSDPETNTDESNCVR